jgi:hypothetical protein
VLGGPASADFADRAKNSDYWLAWVDGRSQVEVPRYDAPPLSALLEADSATFYGAPGDTSRRTAEGVAAYYAAAWRLVHMFLNAPNPDYRARFISFLGALGRGA